MMLGAIVVVLIVDFAVISAGVLALISWLFRTWRRRERERRVVSKDVFG